MTTLNYPPVYLAYFLLQAVTSAAVAFSRFDPGEAWPFFLVWTIAFAVSINLGYFLARRSYVPHGVVQFAPVALAGVVLWLWLALAGPVFVTPVAALGLLLGRNLVLTTRRALYFDTAIVLTLFYNAIGSPYLNYPWPFGIAFLLALLLVLTADYTDRRLSYVRAAGPVGAVELFPGLRNAAFATVLVLAVAVPLYWLMPQPKPLQLALLPGSAPASATYDNPGWFGPSQQSKGGGEKKGAGAPEQATGGTGVPARLDTTRSDGGAGRGAGGDQGAGGASGAAGDKGGGEANAPLLLLYMDADRPLYLRARAYVQPRGNEWIESPREPVLQVRRGYFVLREGPARSQVTQRFRVAAPLDDRIPAAYRPRQIAFPSHGIQFSGDLTLQAPASLARDTEYGVNSGLHYLGARPSGDAEGAPAGEYLLVPDGGSLRTEALALSIVEMRSTPRDKAEALEAHLRANHQRGPFQAEPGPPDATAQFLFLQRQGGSAQFASALAVMLRSAGIPSRIIGGYRARRLNPLHGGYEVWSTDLHYWVEAWLETGWVTFEPSPWAELPARGKPDTSFEAAREYVRLAEEFPDPAPDGSPVAKPDIPPWYLRTVLAWGWLATYGLWLLLGLIALGWASWRWRRAFRPLHDAIDRWRLRRIRRRSPAVAVIAGFAIVERVCARRGLGRAATENHTEYLARLSAFRPYLRAQLDLLASVFATARYGAHEVPGEEAARATVACEEIAELIDETAAVAGG